MKILLVDDEPDVLKSLSNFLKKLGHKVTPAANGLEGLKLFKENGFDIVITDIRMPGMDGLELLRQVKVVGHSRVNVIIITGHGDMDNAITALKYGAYDYLQKPVDVRELAITLERCAEYMTLHSNYTSLRDEFHQRVSHETSAFRQEADRLRKAYLREIGLSDLWVYSDAMRQVIDLAEKYATDRDVPVLIEGESGTGKELIARFIHYYGHGPSLTPFVAINCGAVSQELFEGELFGHERGAYTGATTTGRMGKLEAANGGSIFLDEIGEMPFNLQVKILRVLEEKKLYRLGGVREIPIDVRVISATNKDLANEVAAKRFRLDLFFRINMGYIKIPPLRERREDILPMAIRFISQAAARRGKRFGKFTSAAEDFLQSYSWSGNVRQLRNAMERLTLLGPVEKVHVTDLSFINSSAVSNDGNSGFKPFMGCEELDLPDERLDLERLNREIVKRALEKHSGNQTRTAQYLGLSRRVLQGLLKRAGANSE